jgi:hypothetical protein
MYSGHSNEQSPSRTVSNNIVQVDTSFGKGSNSLQAKHKFFDNNRVAT